MMSASSRPAPELDKALLVASADDQLVVAGLGRLGRSRGHLTNLFPDLQADGIDLVVLDQASARPPPPGECS